MYFICLPFKKKKDQRGYRNCEFGLRLPATNTIQEQNLVDTTTYTQLQKKREHFKIRIVSWKQLN